MPERPYFDESGEPSDAPGRFVHVDDLDAWAVGPGLEFRPVTTDTVMTNFVSFEPNVPTPMHHHVEQQIAIVLSGELTLTVGDETKVMRAGDCVVIPPNVRHGGAARPRAARSWTFLASACSDREPHGDLSRTRRSEAAP
jgi:quercetin dioxygenase-like cupin family protein